ncbi:follicle cell protein 3C-1 [Lucilia cuprina]|uniref:follicle cell protein 3C-1 n=1 Tax=Lucilia cuprina TaxID=7375 RepID=UPI001F053A23|nr:follicle cell protein 3C-1 [Lucilia cuprina]
MDFKTIFFYTFIISSIMLSCCIDMAITKIAYKKPIHLKEKTFGKDKKDILLEIQTTDSTVSLLSKEVEDVIATTPYSKDTSTNDSSETTSKEETTITTTDNVKSTLNSPPEDDFSCTCGIFLSSQFIKGSSEPPKGEPAISSTIERSFACNAIGQKQCQTKCLEQIVQHLPNSANILCASLDRDIRKERAYLFVRNCSNKWYNTNLAAGREYCCKNGLPYSCSKK